MSVIVARNTAKRSAQIADSWCTTRIFRRAQAPINAQFSAHATDCAARLPRHIAKLYLWYSWPSGAIAGDARQHAEESRYARAPAGAGGSRRARQGLRLDFDR